MPELHDLMDHVRDDLTVVRWPAGDELRRRVGRRRQRVIAAAAALVTAMTVGAASLGRPDREAPSPTATSPTVDARPVEIRRSALLRPEDVGAGPDTQADGESAFQPIRFDVMLDLCFGQRAPELLALRSLYSHRQTLLLGTESDRPARPFLLGQAAYRLTAPEAAAFLRDLRSAMESCDGFTQTGEIERSDGKVKTTGRYSWPIAASGFAGDESILVRHDALIRNAATGEVIGESSELSAYLRIGDLVTVLSPRAGTSADDLRQIAITAAERLCPSANPPC
ncbi:hypothetical protein AB0J90_30840 [Micromonospora sp. NPDC049523]|uniref:hypothetical protein n=1 Tax=Micromonospora sp. NPDC049523 TaxID=3155921 RepID=UPI0034239EB8